MGLTVPRGGPPRRVYRSAGGRLRIGEWACVEIERLSILGPRCLVFAESGLAVDCALAVGAHE